MKDLIAGLGWLSAGGSVVGGFAYMVTGQPSVGLFYMVAGSILSAPFFGLAATMKTAEEQGAAIEALREELLAIKRGQRAEAALPASAAPATDKKAPLTSGARKLNQD